MVGYSFVALNHIRLSRRTKMVGVAMKKLLVLKLLKGYREELHEK